MIVPVRLQVENFLSFSSFDYNFIQKEITVIVGENKCDEGQDSNGAGKSAIQEALAIAHTGTSLRGISLDLMIKRGTNQMMVAYVFKDDITGVVTTIKRIISKGKHDLYIDDKKKNTKDGNAIIAELLDISTDDLLNYFLILKGAYLSFFQTTNKYKQEIVARFSNIQLLDSMFEKLNAKIQEQDQNLTELRRELSSFEGKKELLEEQLKNKIEEISVENKIEKQEVLKRQYREVVESANADLEVQARQQTVFKEEIEVVNKELLKLKARLDNSQNELTEIQNDIFSINELKTELTIKTTEIATCPKCNHSFNLTNTKLDLVEVKKDLVNCISLLQEVESHKKQLVEQKTISEKEIAKLKMKISALQDELSLWEKDNFTPIVEKIENYEGLILKCDELIKLFKEFDIKDRATKENDSDKLTKIKDQINKKSEEIRLKSNELSISNQSLVVLKSFKVDLINTVLGHMESAINSILQDIGSNISIAISGYRTLANGNLKEEIEVSVYKDGLYAGLFNSLSNGEKTRIDICGIIALQNFINGSSKNGYDLLFLDEIIESLDITGVNAIIKELNKLNKTILVITHNSVGLICSNVLKITKETDGTSNIKEVG